jgi:hypothetical protein
MSRDFGGQFLFALIALHINLDEDLPFLGLFCITRTVYKYRIAAQQESDTVKWNWT